MRAQRQREEVRIETRQQDEKKAAAFPRRFTRIAAVALSACIFALPFAVRAATQQLPGSAKRTIEQKAPDFVLTDLKGQKFRLSDYRGRQPVLIIFSATWCGFCKVEIPHFKFLHETYGKRGLEVVNIDIQESQERVSRFVAQNQLPYRVLLDRDAMVASIYEIQGVPTMVLVDKNGFIVCRQCYGVETILESMLKR